MIPKLSQLASPALAGVVRERSVRAAVAEITNCIYDGATPSTLSLKRDFSERIYIHSQRGVRGK